MTLLIFYTSYYGAHVFFLPGAHSMLKPALYIYMGELLNIIVRPIVMVLTGLEPASYCLCV